MKKLFTAVVFVMAVWPSAYAVLVPTCDRQLQCGGNPLKCAKWDGDCCTRCETGGLTVITYCALGEYNDGNGNCVRCPDGGTSDGGDGDITICYLLRKGQSFTDDRGSGTYNDNCYYVK